MVVDLRSKDLTGKEGEKRLSAIGMLANKQLVPKDPQKPTVCSGIRIGTPCLTARGLQTQHMSDLADVIHGALSGEDPGPLRARVREICRRHTIP